ncbi:MAG: hypothetical protein GY926_20160 [bacterium]|nr:hypothetical protein [bacterium]
MAGLVAAIGWVYALARLLDGPEVNASEAEILSYYGGGDLGRETLLILQVLFIATAGFLWFVGVIRGRIGASIPKIFDTVFFGGGILLAGLMFVGTASLTAPLILVELGDVAVDPGAAAMIRSFAFVLLGVFATRISALFVFSLSTLGLRTGVMPRWLAIVGYLLGVGLLLDVTFSSPSLYAFPVWLALVSIVLVFHRHRGVAAE